MPPVLSQYGSDFIGFLLQIACLRRIIFRYDVVKVGCCCSKTVCGDLIVCVLWLEVYSSCWIFVSLPPVWVLFLSWLLTNVLLIVIEFNVFVFVVIECINWIIFFWINLVLSLKFGNKSTIEILFLFSGNWTL